jgi:hypothetical protein
MKTIMLAFCLLLASEPSPVKELTLARVDDSRMQAGETVTLKATAIFHEEACDHAPENTSFYARGAEIVERQDWQRIDKTSFCRTVKVRLGKVEEALITVVMIKHEDKITRQLKIPVGN